jgi:hypothetical protein
MPRGDGTGPMGMGPMSGRVGGYCAGFGVPGFANPVPGRGYGMGFGRGRGFFGGGRGWRLLGGAAGLGLAAWRRFGGYGAPYPRVDPETEKQDLKEQADALQAELDFIKKRLSDMETEEIGVGGIFGISPATSNRFMGRFMCNATCSA